jgi:hypothetical protein
MSQWPAARYRRTWRRTARRHSAGWRARRRLGSRDRVRPDSGYRRRRMPCGDR